MTWNWNSFGTLGYAAIAMAAVVPLLLAFALLRRSSPRPLHLAVVLTVFAVACAEINSRFHVDRLEPDRAAEVAAQEAAAEARKQERIAALEAGRDSQVAKIRFAEDARGDALDRAGLDESDLAYLEKIEQEAAEEKQPEWRQEKRTRGDAEGGQESLADRLDADEDPPAGVDAGATDPEAVREPIVVSEAELAAAHRVDRLCLGWARLLLLGGLVLTGVDWLRRANDYEQAYLPLPVPSRLLAAARPLPAVVVRPEPPRRSVAEELAWLLRRGDSFVYLAANATAAGDILTKLTRFENLRRPVQVVRVGDGGEACSDRFIFESLWYGRCSFVIDSPDRAERLVKAFGGFLEERQATRARAAQAAHIVWDLSAAADGPAFLEAWRSLLQTAAGPGGRAGFSILFCSAGGPLPAAQTAEIFP